MDRRKFLGGAATGAAGFGIASTLAAPAIAQSNPKIQWRVTSSFPKSLDTLYGTAEKIAKYVHDVSDGQFDIQVFAAGEIVPGGQVLDAVQNDTVELGHTASYYYVGKNPAYAFGTAVPFGLNARQMNAWFYEGGGNDLLNTFYAKNGIYAMPAGNTGAQMGGWYRKEINTLDDLKGLKLRIAGLAGRVVEKLGVVPQQIAAGDIYASLERGTLDAVEFVGPYDDEKLGFVKVAPFYYYPAWWEGGASLHLMVNLDKWNSLPKNYQALLQAASQAANCAMLADYDYKNPAALKRLVAQGAKLRPFSQDIMEASFKAAQEVHKEIAAENADYKTLLDSQNAFKNDAYLWAQLSEYTFDTFMMIQQRNGTLLKG
ncbi:TRAP transporter substrate-binding protein [Aurantimonas sp. VKM B-3413]|uniref:TRAP transporter substrate-binding protein n=1 Tax=Aurantimonas sp. VKM B-3413 TaxID=2779401 RepID=UPI001E4D4C3A|nr:TRAP transporter substrate-binding protein [Aurantimonas sp. VKM B-3413]MCB8840061.1 TRAP transporter substrate-binding protein [Aurantimonas sp. VKM B-3413]